MRVSALGADELAALLAGPGLHLRTGPALTRIRSRAPAIAEHVARLYGEHRWVPDECAESTVQVRIGRERLRPWRQRARLLIDGAPVMHPLAAGLAVPMLEWAMNWVVASRAHRHLLLHAAVAERDGRALLLPGASGAGKTTLCALLVARGWRLLSDEFAIIDPARGSCVPMPRPPSFKNDAIAIARAAFPDGVFAPEYRRAAKGTLCYMRPPLDAVAREMENAAPALVVLPRFAPGTGCDPRPLGPAQLHAALAGNAMNYGALGEAGFRCVAGLAGALPAWRLAYDDTERALGWLEATTAAAR
jgi:HprK-related kinase A